MLEYSPDTGEMRWRIDKGMRIKAGSPAGHVSKRGYLWIGIDGVVYLGHRLAWCYMTGKWPDNLVDHRDTDKGNNRWDNLRQATNSQNLGNRGPSRANTTGIKNVYRRESPNRPWRVQVRSGTMFYIGAFATREEAAAAAQSARDQHFGEFARG